MKNIIIPKLINTMKNIINKLLEHDKLKHFFVGFLIFIAFSALVGNLIGFLITMVIGFSYEIYQKLSDKGEPQYLDAVYTALAGFLVYLVSVL
jgi:zinc transporter ZupT